MSRETKLIEIIEADYHRNGVGGEGFYVGTVVVTMDGETDQHRMLVTYFPHHDEDGERSKAGRQDGEYANGRVAVLDLDRLPTIKFGHNSWRGDNFYAIADAIVQRVSDDQDALMAKIVAQAEARKAAAS